jgi:DNA-binding GntR family transcriptional regulator
VSTLNERVTDQLRAAILDGRIAPGSPLNQRDIAAQLGVSRMPVREAFRALEIEGLIRGLPRRKAIVVELSAEDIHEIFDILATLEARAAERAAAALSPEARREVRNAQAEFEAAADEAALAGLDLAFHSALYAPTPRLSALVMAQRDAVRPYLLAHDVVRERRKQAEDEHARIVVALNAWDTRRAAEATAAHVRAEADALIAALPVADQDGD